jgi:hypothetical protein
MGSEVKTRIEIMATNLGTGGRLFRALDGTFSGSTLLHRGLSCGYHWFLGYQFLLCRIAVLLCSHSLRARQ